MSGPSAKWHEAATPNTILGGAWLVHHYGLRLVQWPRTASRIAGSRSTENYPWGKEVTFTEPYRPEPTLAGHLEFHLKHETVHLELLARLFGVCDEADLADWIDRQPTGGFARRACFFYEWLTGRTLAHPGVQGGNYVDALDPKKGWTSTWSLNNARWRVRDNLPGSAEFCPTVVWNDQTREAAAFDLRARWNDLAGTLGEDLLARAAVWMTTKESRASFAIEGEERETGKIARFAAMTETESGRSDAPLNPNRVRSLQRFALGDDALAYGFRRSPVFVGHTFRYADVVDYIAPHHAIVPSLMTGLVETEKRSRGGPSVVRAAALSFGFVYVHPLADGNGRLSRFLVNDVFRLDGAIPASYVVPVSAAILGARGEYDRALEAFSAPLMKRFAGAYRFGPNERYDDGLTSTLVFDDYTEAEPAYRYPDLTSQTEYLVDVVRRTLDTELPDEARTIRRYRAARDAVKDIVEAPDSVADRIVRSLTESRFVLSGKLLAEYPSLSGERGDRIAAAVRAVFETGTE